MEFIPQVVSGCYLIGLQPIADDRGFFGRAFSTDEFGSLGLESRVAQVNISQSKAKGTIRGVHWQRAPHGEAKIVRCIEGSIFDVCVDVRTDSPTFARWVGVELTSQNHLALYIPPGCGHAHQTLEPDSKLLYMTSYPYTPSAEAGARWDDPAFGIEWPIVDAVTLSDKDRSWPDFGG